MDTDQERPVRFLYTEYSAPQSKLFQSLLNVTAEQGSVQTERHSVQEEHCSEYTASDTSRKVLRNECLLLHGTPNAFWNQHIWSKSIFESASMVETRFWTGRDGPLFSFKSKAPMK